MLECDHFSLLFSSIKISKLVSIPQSMIVQKLIKILIRQVEPMCCKVNFSGFVVNFFFSFSDQPNGRDKEMKEKKKI